MKFIPELLAPAGSMKALEAAARHGADAVYFGIGTFNARANADNIEADQLNAAVDYLHKWSAKAYLALNILLSDHEMKFALELVDKAYCAGIDGLIVQDIGFASQIKKYFPNLPLHASTQMTITDEAGLAEASGFGFQRVILPRELSLDSIARLTEYANKKKLETEVFVHGALCISYSGQCLMSSVKAGRSANRGLCSQPCRLNYQCLAAGSGLEEEAGEYVAEQPQPLISPRDQALIQYLPQLAAANVSSVKIEGRMRSAEYTALVVSQYREALDQISGNNDELFSDESSRKEKLLLAFNRGGDFTDRYLTGNRNNQKPFLTGSYPGSFGLELGRISDVNSRYGTMSIVISQERRRLPVRFDVLSVRRPGSSTEIASAPIGSIDRQGRLITVKGFHPDAILKFRTGDYVYWMTDSDSINNLDKSNGYKTQISLRLSIIQAASDQAAVTSSEYIMEAQILNRSHAGLTEIVRRKFEHHAGGVQIERIASQLKKTGNTPFEVKNVTIHGCSDDKVKINVAQINQLRREIVDQLIKKMILRRELVNIDDGKKPVEPDAICDDFLKKIDYSDKGRFQIHVWYQKMPSDINEICCGADVYILPLWAVNRRSARVYVDKLKEKDDCRVFVWLPPAPQNEISEWMMSTVSELSDLGIDGITGGHFGIKQLAENNFACQIDSTANITNARSCLEYLNGKPQSLALSSELSIESCLAIRNHDLLTNCWNDSALTLQVYGRQRLMSSIFCPVGKNVSGCKKCHLPETGFNPDAARSYHFIDAKKERFHLQTHPRFCTMDLLDNKIYFDENIFALISPTSPSIAFRFDFYNENHQERIGLVDSVRKCLNTNDFSNPAGLRKAAADAAARQNSEIVSQRRHIYD